MKLSSILIEGQVGTGKTALSRYVAYLNKMGQLNADKLENIEDYYLGPDQVSEMAIHDDCIEYIQVHESMGYEDIVYGLGTTEKEDGLSYDFVAKRIKLICESAQNHRDIPYTIILDDFHRNNQDELFRQLKYCIVNRNETIRIASGISLVVPDNVLFVFTMNPISITNQIKFGNWKFDKIIRLKSSRKILENAYSNNSVISKTVLTMYDWLKIYLDSNCDKHNLSQRDEIMLGHGLFLIPLVEDNKENYLTLRNKIDFQIIPSLKILEEKKYFERDLLLSIKLLSFVNVGNKEHNEKIIKKVLHKKNESLNTNIMEINDYYQNEIAPNITDKSYGVYRYFMETIIDAMLFNGLLPQQLIFSQLLTNPLIIKVNGKKGKIASYLLDIKDIESFTYKSGVNRGDRRLYTLNQPSSGKWKEQKDIAVYEVKLGNQTTEFIYLNQFRPSSRKKYIREVSLTNTAPIIPAIYQLVEGYLELYERECRISDKPELLIKYIELERRILDYYGSEVSDYNLFCRRLLNIKLLWGKAVDSVMINKAQLNGILNHEILLNDETINSVYEEPDITISFEEINYMKNLEQYIGVMDRLNVRQMILQGPPGTSKTFSAKELILSSLNAKKYEDLLLQHKVSSESLALALSEYKLDDTKYRTILEDKKEGGIANILVGGWDVVQFHPSYSYEDFIRGIRVDFKDKTPNYEQVNRILGKMANIAFLSKNYVNAWNDIHSDEKKEIPKFYLLIDEINRANLSAVLGELIYGLEYRDNPITTPYSVSEVLWDKEIKEVSSKDILIPDNLYIIGTMNTADRSIDNIDYAIRRRFIFVDCPPCRDIVEGSIPEGERAKCLELILFDAVQNIFKDANQFFNVEFQKNDVLIGHTYFIRHSDRNETSVVEMCDRFVYQVMPILMEYVKDGILNIKNKTHQEFAIEEIKQGYDADKIMNNIVFWLKHYGEKVNDEIVNDSYIYNFIKSIGAK